MGLYILIGIIWHLLLRIVISETTEYSDISETLFDLLDKENPNFDTLLSEAKKYGVSYSLFH